MRTSAAPRPSSTVIVARRAAAQPEIFMVKRHAATAFGAAYAFPGGVVDAADAKVHPHCDLRPAEANARLGVETGGLDYYSAAIRELFEETGILLAHSPATIDGLDAVRDGLNAGTLDWADFVAARRLRLDCSELHYVSHWVTPESRKARYTTRFFIAELPPGQQAAHCGGELVDSCWRTPTEMLEAARQGDAEIRFPTLKTLESLARHRSLEALLDWAASCVDWGVTTMLPAIVERNGKPTIVLPGERDYPGQRQ